MNVRYFILLLVVAISFHTIAGSSKNLVDLPKEALEEVLLPLKLIENEQFKLREHPFNSDAYWLIDEDKFDPSLDSIDSYGVSISMPPEPLWKQFYEDFKGTEHTNEKIVSSDKCLIKKHLVNNELNKVFILLELKGEHYMISGQPEFIEQNIKVSVCDV